MAVWIAGSSPAMTIRLRIKIERHGRRFCGRKIPRKKALQNQMYSLFYNDNN